MRVSGKTERGCVREQSWNLRCGVRVFMLVREWHHRSEDPVSRGVDGHSVASALRGRLPSRSKGWQVQSSFVLLVVCSTAGAPMTWSKTAGGYVVSRVGFELSHRTHMLGIAARRAEHFCAVDERIAAAHTVKLGTCQRHCVLRDLFPGANVKIYDASSSKLRSMSPVLCETHPRVSGHADHQNASLPTCC